MKTLATAGVFAYIRIMAERTITHIFIHATGADPNQSVASIKAYWKNVMKWKNVGYHRIVEKNGTEHILATDDKVTNGVAGYNSNSIHLCYIGGKLNGKYVDTRSTDQKLALEKWVRYYAEKYPKAKVLGHRDISPDKNKNGKIDTWEFIKSCPCFSVEDWLREVHFP